MNPYLTNVLINHIYSPGLMFVRTVHVLELIRSSLPE
jgi:hypothetical protein